MYEILYIVLSIFRYISNQHEYWEILIDYCKQDLLCKIKFLVEEENKVW
jgi:hypothetical protein